MPDSRRLCNLTKSRKNKNKKKIQRCRSASSYSSRLKNILKNGTNPTPIKVMVFGHFQLVLVPRISNLVCWSHFFILWKTLQSVWSKLVIRYLNGTNTHQGHGFWSLLISIGPMNHESSGLVPLFHLVENATIGLVEIDKSDSNHMRLGTNRCQHIPTVTNNC